MSVITVNMSKARDVHRDRLRQARTLLLNALDVEYIRAHEANGDTSATVARKQALRDVTKHPDIEAAQTLADLKKVWPACLGARS
jgi:hypothetical protein